MHTGELDLARAQGRRNLSVFPSDVDAILTNAAGCGSGMKEYALIFRGTEFQIEAEAFAGHVQDICQFLDTLGLVEPAEVKGGFRLAYHDACHLAHAQGITAAPRPLAGADSQPGVIAHPGGRPMLRFGGVLQY